MKYYKVLYKKVGEDWKECINEEGTSTIFSSQGSALRTYDKLSKTYKEFGIEYKIEIIQLT